MLRKLPQVLKFLPLIAIAIGCLLVGGYFIRHLPEFLKSWVTSTQHPTLYRFTVYDNLLKKYVKDGLVDYKSLSKDPGLNVAVGEIENIAGDKMDGKEQLCFWLNSLNLLTIKIVCDRYLVKDTVELSSDISARKFIVSGEPLSLQQIQDRYVMPLMKNPTIRVETVFLICRGSLAYPPLTDHAITPETMEDDAKIAAYKFINDKRNVLNDEDTLNFYLSPLLKRYESVIDEKVHKNPHHFVVLYMVTKKPINVDNLMVTKTYFPNTNYTLNDTALAAEQTDARKGAK